MVPSTYVMAQQNSRLPDAPMPPRVLPAQSQTLPPTGGAPQTPLPMPSPSAHAISIEQALDLAKRNNPTLQANQKLILQNKAQEITANLRPNPVFSGDTQFLPSVSPSREEASAPVARRGIWAIDS